MSRDFRFESRSLQRRKGKPSRLCTSAYLTGAVTQVKKMANLLLKVDTLVNHGTKTRLFMQSTGTVIHDNRVNSN